MTRTNANKKVLFFIKATNPTKEDLECADTIVGKVLFRNSRFIDDDDKPEACDAVAGEIIPESYSDKPRYEFVVANKQKKPPKKAAPRRRSPKVKAPAHTSKGDDDSDEDADWSPNTDIDE